MQVHFILATLLLLTLPLINTQQLNLSLGHVWEKRKDTVTIYFDISNSSMNEYRYYFFNLRPFASYGHAESYPKQRLVDTHNSLRIVGLHENDYVSCVSFIDEYENLLKPRSTCYEFTLGEKTIGSHHGGSSGYLAPLLLAFAFVIHVFIAVVHHIKAKNYAGKLFHRFRDVNPKIARRIINARQSLKQLDHYDVPASVQRRLSRVAIDTDDMDDSSHYTDKSNDEASVYVLPHHNRKVSLGVMNTIHEYNP